jgi:hypothetical protein
MPSFFSLDRDWIGCFGFLGFGFGLGCFGFLGFGFECFGFFWIWIWSWFFFGLGFFSFHRV